jgi:hypothetical protein
MQSHALYQISLVLDINGVGYPQSFAIVSDVPQQKTPVPL